MGGGGENHVDLTFHLPSIATFASAAKVNVLLYSSRGHRMNYRIKMEIMDDVWA